MESKVNQNGNGHLSVTDELVWKAVNRDAEAIGALHVSLFVRMTRFIESRMCGAVHGLSAEDVASEAMIKAIAKLDRFSGGQVAFCKWVHTIARHTLCDLKRRGKFNGSEQVSSNCGEAADDEALAAATGHEEQPSTVLSRRETKQALDSAMAALPDRHRLVVHLRHDLQMRWREIAAYMDISCDAAQGLFKRALHRMRSSLGSKSRFLP